MSHSSVPRHAAWAIQFFYDYLAHLLGRHLRQAPTHILDKIQNFLVAVVHTWNKTWRRRKKEELRNRSFFSAYTWGTGANVL